MEFAIVDIETTGGYAAQNGITELSVFIHDGNNVVERFETLINPGKNIPYYISGLTGITNNMVRRAPSFGAVAEHIFRLLHNRVFVAHSVNFDYSFIKEHLKRHGFSLQTKKLCTVRLSRAVFPGLPSYSLGNLCGALDIPIQNRHRAGGDAAATVLLFELLLKTNREAVLKSLKRGSKEQALPPHLSKEEFEQLPDTTGVYYFLNRKGKVIYVGKAINIKKRVAGHFSSNTPHKQRQEFIRHVYHIRCMLCASEQEAFQLENREIKRLFPLLNKAQKKPDVKFTLITYTDQQGYIRFGIKKVKAQPHYTVLRNTIIEVHELIRQMVATHGLCLRLSGITKTRKSCQDENCACMQDAETYNTNALPARDALTLSARSPTSFPEPFPAQVRLF